MKNVINITIKISKFLKFLISLMSFIKFFLFSNKNIKKKKIKEKFEESVQYKSRVIISPKPTILGFNIINKKPGKLRRELNKKNFIKFFNFSDEKYLYK